LRDIVAGEELLAAAFVVDQLREVLDGLGHPVVADHRMALADVPNGSQHFVLIEVGVTAVSVRVVDLED
jgi:hypothetical protein